MSALSPYAYLGLERSSELLFGLPLGLALGLLLEPLFGSLFGLALGLLLEPREGQPVPRREDFAVLA